MIDDKHEWSMLAYEHYKYEWCKISDSKTWVTYINSKRHYPKLNSLC